MKRSRHVAKAFIRKRRLKHRAVADSLEEAGDRLFTFTRLPPSQWRSARTTNAIERLHEEFKASHQDADRAALHRNRGHVVLGIARVRPDQYAQKSMDGRPWPPSSSISRLTSPLDRITSFCRRSCHANSNHIPGSTLTNLVIDWWRMPVLLNGRRLSRWAILSLVLCGCAPDPKAITAECEQRAASEGEQVVSDCIDPNRRVEPVGMVAAPFADPILDRRCASREKPQGVRSEASWGPEESRRSNSSQAGSPTPDG